MKCIVLKPSHIQGFLCNFKIEGDISISLHKKWSWSPCRATWINLGQPGATWMQPGATWSNMEQPGATWNKNETTRKNLDLPPGTSRNLLKPPWTSRNSKSLSDSILKDWILSFVSQCETNYTYSKNAAEVGTYVGGSSLSWSYWMTCWCNVFSLQEDRDLKCFHWLLTMFCYSEIVMEQPKEPFITLVAIECALRVQSSRQPHFNVYVVFMVLNIFNFQIVWLYNQKDSYVICITVALHHTFSCLLTYDVSAWT